MDNFSVERTLLDVTFGGLSPNETRTFESTTKQMTSNTVTSGSSQGYAQEITSVEVIPPQVPAGQANAGAYEDLREIWLILDEKPVQHYINLSGYGESLMNPPKTQIWGSRFFQVIFGEPFHRVVKDATSPNPNMPIRNTTLKYNKTLSLAVHTLYGVTGQWRIIVKGFTYDNAMLKELAGGWKNTVNVQTTRRVVTNKPALTFTFPLAGPINTSTWTTLPGGQLQGGTKINPYWRFAYNGQQTQPQSPYVFSNFNELSGSSGNVEDPFQELGFKFAENLNAFILKGFGVRGVKAPPGTPPTTAQFAYPSYPGTPGENLSRAGWWVNGDLVPEVTGNQGRFLTNGVNDMQFGMVRPLIALDNLFLPMPKYPGDLLIYQDNAAPFIGANGSPIPPFSVMVAYNGVLVERG